MHSVCNLELPAEQSGARATDFVHTLSIRANKMGIERRDIEKRFQKSHAEGVYRLKGAMRGRERIAIYMLPGPLAAGTRLRIGPKDYEVKTESYLVFIDLMHMANYAHPVIYELHAVSDGSVTTIEEQFPLADRKLENSLIPLVTPNTKGR